MSQFINYHSLSGKAGIDRTDEAQPSSEHRCLALAQPQANGENHINQIKKGKFFIVFILLFCSACQYTPLGGGDLVVSNSIAESKEKGMFKREYAFPDSILEYRDSIVNIKLVFSDVFVETVHKEKRRIPEYKEKKYYNKDCDSCGEQFVAYFNVEKCELTDYIDYWFIDENMNGKAMRIFTYNTYEKNIQDTLILHILSAYKYRERVGIDYKICFDTLTFVKK